LLPLGSLPAIGELPSLSGLSFHRRCATLPIARTVLFAIETSQSALQKHATRAAVAHGRVHGGAFCSIALSQFATFRLDASPSFSKRKVAFVGHVPASVWQPVA
jgi:hypothetical protein